MIFFSERLTEDNKLLKSVFQMYTIFYNFNFFYISESMILDGEQGEVARVGGERQGELRQCAGCGNKIHDQYLLQVFSPKPSRIYCIPSRQ